MFFAAAAAKSLQSCLTLCDPIDSSPAGSPVPGIFQARTLEWVAVSFSNNIFFRRGQSYKLFELELSSNFTVSEELACMCVFVTLWTVALQVSLSTRFSRQE